LNQRKRQLVFAASRIAAAKAVDDRDLTSPYGEIIVKEERDR
jgi:hypothetical protein